jgi:5-methylthioadenosine/S-adenosylhomocysteine deaminase
MTAGYEPADLAPGRPIVFRNGTVLTMDAAHHLLTGADVLVTGDSIAAVGPALAVPDGTAEIDASDGVLMPGMIDTHRHMWQTAMRGYGADWTHGLQTVEHAEAAVDALTEVPGRFVLAYGNIQQGPWEWSATPEFLSFVSRRFTAGNDMLGFQMAFDVTGDPAFPERAAFEVARELGAPVTTHAGVWGATNDDGIRLMHEGGFMTPSHHLRARGHADARFLQSHRRDRWHGVGVDRERAECRAGLSAHLAAPRARHRGIAVDGHQHLVER